MKTVATRRRAEALDMWQTGYAAGQAAAVRAVADARLAEAIRQAEHDRVHPADVATRQLLTQLIGVLADAMRQAEHDRRHTSEAGDTP